MDAVLHISSDYDLSGRMTDLHIRHLWGAVCLERADIEALARTLASDPSLVAIVADIHGEP